MKRTWYAIKKRPGKPWSAVQRKEPDIEKIRGSFAVAGPFKTRGECIGRIIEGKLKGSNL